MTIKEWQKEVHELATAKGWWEGGDRNTGELLMLVVTELAEAMEEFRNSDTLDMADTYSGPTGKPEGFGVELADAVIRIFDTAEAYGIDLQQCIETKHAYNKTRPYRHGGKRA